MRHGATVRGILEVLEVLARGFAAAGQGRHSPGPAAVATWRSPTASGRHPGAQPPENRAAVPQLPRDVTPSLQLKGVLSTRAFRALADGTTRTAGWDAQKAEW